MLGLHILLMLFDRWGNQVLYISCSWLRDQRIASTAFMTEMFLNILKTRASFVLRYSCRVNVCKIFSWSSLLLCCWCPADWVKGIALRPAIFFDSWHVPMSIAQSKKELEYFMFLGLAFKCQKNENDMYKWKQNVKVDVPSSDWNDHVCSKYKN